MARKQSDYLADLLADEVQGPSADASEGPQHDEPSAVPVPHSSSRAGLSLLGRESALARVASGEVKQVTQLQLDPDRVRVWAGNARMQARLSEVAVRDLIDSILAEGGQKVPVVVRRVTGDPGCEYEVIAGTRRHFAISWLRSNNYPEMKLLAQVAELDDEAAFRLADVENRARKDVSDIERARNYASALEAHYGGKAVRMSERLKVSKGWLSKMLKAATIPDGILAAFPDLGELTLNPAYVLATALDDKSRAKAIVSEARNIVAEFHRLAARGAPLPAGIAIHRRLMNATATAAGGASKPHLQIAGHHGRPIMQVKSVNRQGVTLLLPTGGGASDEHLKDALQQVLEALRQDGVRLT